MAGPVYQRAESVEEATALLARHGDDAHVLAGGQSLMVLMNMGLADPGVLVDIDRVPGLEYLRRDDGRLRIGALTRHAQIEHSTEELGGFSVLRQTAHGIAYPAIRERGTFGGVLAHADPTGEWCSLVQALDGEVIAQGSTGTRSIPADEFFEGPLMTALAPDEVVVEVVLGHEFAHSHLEKLEPLHPEFQAVVAAAAYDLEAGTIRRARIAVGGTGGAPRRLPDAEAVLEGAERSDEAIAEAARTAAGTVTIHASDEPSIRYGRRVVETLVRRALAAA